MQDDIYFSIITPCFNTDKKYMDECFESVQLEYEKFNQIEWIIVLHNCTSEYKKFIYSKVNKLKFIHIFEINNDLYTAASPRNVGIEHAKGKYLYFLDSDDKIGEGCFKLLYEKILEYNPEIIIYNVNVIAKDKDIVNIKLKLLYKNETYIDKVSKDMQELLYGTGVLMWSKVYKVDFINKYNIRFDENLVHGEDITFTGRCYRYVNKILILPNIIGYNYFQHNGSLLQNIGEDENIDYFRYIDCLINDIKGRICTDLFLFEEVNFIMLLLFKKKMPKNIRKEIAERMKNYVKKINFNNLPKIEEIKREVEMVKLFNKC